MIRLCTLVALLFSFFCLHAQDVNVTGFNGEVHEGGNTLSKMIDFPSSVSNYGMVMMNVSLDCPTGGCDPWDRFSQLSVMTDEGDEIEIGRFVTPYGNNNCGWVIDVTAYRDILVGSTELKSHIETYQNGWEIYTDFDFIEIEPDFEHVQVTELYRNNQLTYGDTIFYSINLPDYDVTIPENAEEVIFRVINTGHGQGNTENAAEFSQKTHSIQVNGEEIATQFLWKSDCGVNPCSPQGGNWQFNRAGWCPGQNVEPWDYDITDMATPGGSVNLDYVLEPFFNQCSPWNPDCNDGATCASCTYDNNGHTTPVYKIALQVIVKSSTPLSLLDTEIGDVLGLDFFPNPSQGIVEVRTREDANGLIKVLDITGQEVLNVTMPYRAATLDLSGNGAGVYLILFEGENGSHTERIVIDK